MKKYNILSLLLFLFIQTYSRDVIYITVPTTNVQDLVNKEIIIAGKSELHISASSTPLTNSIIRLEHEDAWVFFPNLKPQFVVDSVIAHIRVFGQQAVPRQNVRVSIFRHGAVVIPHGENFEPLTIYTDRDFGGESRKFNMFNFHNDLKQFDNRTRSFKLKRGYMATLANNPDGTGYSRVFIADNADLEISAVSSWLDNTVSFIRVFNYEWVTKKGWCQTGWRSGGSEVANSNKTNSTWFYTWSVDNNSTYNQEYVLIKQNLYWPGWSSINSKKWASHLMSYNEPDHSNQANVTVNQAVNAWPDHLKTGLRLGSPATTDFNWLYAFMDGCRARNYRVDYVVIHAYWPAMSASQWRSELQKVYDRTGRPIWIKEWNNGANWTNESWPSSWSDQMTKQHNDIKAIVEMLDAAPFIERYSIYNWVEGKRAMILDDGWLTPAGRFYADNNSTIAFRRSHEVVPGYSFSSVNNTTLTLNATNESGGGVVLSWTNATQEFASRVVVDRRIGNGPFQEIYNSNQTSIQSFVDTPDFSQAGRVEYMVSIVLNNGTVITSNPQSYVVTPGDEVDFGKFSYRNANWNAIGFLNRYPTLPVTIFGSPTNNNLNVLFTNRVRMSNPGILSFQLLPWAYQNVSVFDYDETVPYFFLRPGAYQWGGISAQANRTTATSEWQRITFPDEFSSQPVVFVTQSTTNNDFPVTVRVRNVTKDGFDVILQKEAVNTQEITSEVFSYLAVEQGEGVVNGRKVIVGRTAENAVGNAITQFARITYGETIENPVFFAQLQTANDELTATLRCRSILTTEARVFKQRELSQTGATPANETAGWIVINPDVVMSAPKTSETRLSIYPNPVADRLFVIRNSSEAIRAEIYSLSGVLVHTQLIHGNTVDVSQLGSGYYFLRIDGSAMTKFVKL